VIQRHAVSPRPRTAIVCDTTAYVPEKLLDELDVHRVSLYVTLDGETRPEAEIADYGAFYEQLGRSDEGATTSQPSVGDFLAVYEPLLADGAEIVSIHLSAGISGTCEAARQARERLIEGKRGGERVHVVDSRTGCGGMGLLVLAGGRAAESGQDAAGVLERVQQVRDRLRMWFAIDTLEYLRKGGRIGAAQAWIGTTLKIKPILTLDEEITPIERVRTRRRALERMMDFARERQDAGADGWVVQYIVDADAARTLVEHGRSLFGSDPVFVSEIGPVIGAHIGPGLVGVGGVPRGLLGAPG
jgi:DegV family protein with EDD domain